MKTAVIGAQILLLMMSSVAFAAMEDFSVTVGAASWYNRFVPISRIEGMDVPRSTYAFMYGPAVRAQYKNFYLGITYLLSASDYALLSPDTIVRVRRASAESAASRSDLDLVAGYQLTPQFGVTVGYKNIYVDDTITLTSQGVAANARRHESYSVGTLGAEATVPLGENGAWRSTCTAVLGTFHNDIAYPVGYRRLNEPVYDAFAWGGEGTTKISYKMIKTLSAEVGLKAGYIKSGSDNSSFFGPIFGLNYTF